MADQKPLVLADDRSGVTGQPVTQRLQSGDDLDIPLNERVEALEIQMAELARFLIAQGFELPGELEELL
jgi:hypothetical protein